METLCPNESQLLEKVQVYYPGKGRDQIASFTAILIKCAFFLVFLVITIMHFLSEHLENEEMQGRKIIEIIIPPPRNNH